MKFLRGAVKTEKELEKWELWEDVTKTKQKIVESF